MFGFSFLVVNRCTHTHTHLHDMIEICLIETEQKKTHSSSRLLTDSMFVFIVV